MTTRSDVTVFYHLDPRLIVVQAPSTEMTMQDLHDTLQDIDDEPANMSYPHLVQSAGKEELGGGVTVGITLTLRNAQIAFARRETILDTGTCTSDSPTGFTLQQIIDTSATFQSSNIERGMWVSNNTKGFICEIVSVDSETQLSVLNSTLGDWETGDPYVIWETEVCNLTGGNLVATDYDGNTIQSVFPTYATSTTKTASSSATASAQQQLEYGTFAGGVHIDFSSTYSGTAYPIGTPQQPVNNFSDALTINQTRGFGKLFLYGDATFGTGLDFTGLVIEGESPTKSTFTITSGADVTETEFMNATVQGTLDGGNVLTDCSLLSITYVEGIIQRCLLLETVTLSGAATAFFLDCWSGVPGSQTPTINMGGSGSELAVRNYSGGLKLTNRSGTDPVSIDMNSGQIVIDDTVTAGTITLRGVAKWTNEKTYAGGATINSELITFQDTQQLAFTESKVHLDQNSGYSGTAYPRGTARMPINNIVDALIVASGNTISDFHINGLITIPSGTDVSNYSFSATNGYQGQLYFTPGCITEDIGIRNVGVLGTMNGRQYIENCSLINTKNIDGSIQQSVLIGALSLDITSNNDYINFTNCYTSKITEPYPTLDFQGSGVGAYFTAYTGAIEFINKTGDDEVWFTGNASSIILDDTVTNGFIHLGGTGHWKNQDTYAGGANVTNHMANPTEIQRDMYEDGITFNTTTGVAGTYHPIGTPELPVNNWTDLLAISAARDVTNLIFDEQLTYIPSGIDLTGYTVYGKNAFRTQIACLEGSVVDEMDIQEAFITGYLGEKMALRNCWIQNVQDFTGVAFNCLMSQTISLASGNPAAFLSCYGDSERYGTPTISYNNADTLTVRRYNGKLEITNKLNTKPCAIDITGRVNIDDTCASGTIVLRGNGTWENKSTYAGASTIIDELSVDSNIVLVSGEPVSINDFVGEAATLTSEAIADAVWDEVLTGATHNIASSAGRRLRDVSGNVIFGGTVASGTINTVFLDNDASDVDGAYDPALIAITTGLAAGQSRLIYQYDGDSRMGVVDRNWKVIPDNTSEYIISAHPGREHVNEGLAQGGTLTSVALNANASSYDNTYNDQLIFIRSGTGEDQVRVIQSYDGTTKTITIDDDEPFYEAPDNTSAYVIIPAHVHPTAQIAERVWDNVMDAGYTAEETMKIMIASLAGKLSGAAGTTITIRDVNDTKPRITATVDEDGNRLSVTLDGS